MAVLLLQLLLVFHQLLQNLLVSEVSVSCSGIKRISFLQVKCRKTPDFIKQFSVPRKLVGCCFLCFSCASLDMKSNFFQQHLCLLQCFSLPHPHWSRQLEMGCPWMNIFPTVISGKNLSEVDTQSVCQSQWPQEQLAFWETNHLNYRITREEPWEFNSYCNFSESLPLENITAKHLLSSKWHQPSSVFHIHIFSYRWFSKPWLLNHIIKLSILNCKWR